MKTLDQKVVVVTGASSGIGRATARLLARHGARLALVDIDEVGLKEVEKECQKEEGFKESVRFLVDVSNREAMDELAQKVVNTFGEVHVVINNAGINVTADFEEHTLEDFDRVFDVNIYGVVYGCHYFLPHLKKSSEAHIVNISSIFGIVGVAGQTAYSASKFAVRGFSEALHEELAESSVRVTVVHPGCINTNIVKKARISDESKAPGIIDFFEKYGADPEAVGRRILRSLLKDEHRVLVTPESYALDLFRRVSPFWGNRLANRLMAIRLGVK